jgi:RHS repeat-associated protein
MNPAVYGSLPGDACTASTLDTTNGPDRIAKNTYDASGRVTKVQTAYGQTEQTDEVTLTYTANGRVGSVMDGEANLTTYEYDGVDRLKKTRYPVTTQGSNSSSTTDYEQMTYDANGNVLSRQLRDGATLNFSYDALNRLILKDVPTRSGLSTSHTRDVYYGYDLLGRLTYARFDSATGEGVTNVWDALGRLSSTTSNMAYDQKTLSYLYDAAGRRTRVTWPDSLYLVYDYDVAGSLTAIRENGATSGIGVLASYAYDSLGSRTGITRGNGTTTSYSWDALSRLSSLAHDLSGSSYDLTIGSVTYNPAGQIASLSRSNDTYAWSGHSNVNRNYTVNGLNQTTASGSTSLSYDSNGNVTSDGTSTYLYDVENRLVGVSGGHNADYRYDPLGRLWESSSNGTNYIRRLYDGYDLVLEHSVNSNDPPFRRFVHAAGVDEPVVWYEGSATSDRRFLAADERGSVVAVTDASGAISSVNRYDEFGIPQSSNAGRFQYTGQAWLPEAGLSYYKARMYSPILGRFMQTDPIGYADGINWYNYVGGDPVNQKDPMGMSFEMGWEVLAEQRRVRDLVILPPNLHNELLLINIDKDAPPDSPCLSMAPCGDNWPSQKSAGRWFFENFVIGAKSWIFGDSRVSCDKKVTRKNTAKGALNGMRGGAEKGFLGGARAGSFGGPPDTIAGAAGGAATGAIVGFLTGAGEAAIKEACGL